MNWKSSAIVSVIALFLSWPAFTQTKPKPKQEKVDPNESVQIRNVEIEGLVRTERFVLDREFLFKPNSVTTRGDIEESVQRLRNMGIFRIANYHLVRVSEVSSAYDIHIYVDERWTLLPTGSFNFGGNLFSLTVGAFDTNVLGRYIELGGFYQRLGTTNSFVLWAYDPRFLDQRLFGGTDFWWTNRLRYLFTDDGELEGGYLRFRRQFRLLSNKELYNWLNVGLAANLQFDEFSYELVSEEVQDEQDLRGGPPPDARSLIFTPSVVLGRINVQHSYVLSGVRFLSAFAFSQEFWGSTESFTEYTGELKGFLPLPLHSNLGGRLGFGVTSSDAIEQQFFIGGFGTLRGFIDSRFRGSTRWYSNVEYRIPSFDYKWFVLQHIAFLDAAGAADSVGNIGTIDGASAGLGLRVIIPKLTRFVARIDYAWGLQGNATAPLSFGAGQFF